MKVLFVEDNPVTTHSISKILENKGYEVFCAKDLESAEKIINDEEGFTHLLCDYDLQGENGLYAAKAFHERFPDAGILIFTGHKEFLRNQDVIDFYAANTFARYLRVEYKPIEQNQLFSWFNEVNKKRKLQGAGEDN